jgi:hypothetical protein
VNDWSADGEARHVLAILGLSRYAVEDVLVIDGIQRRVLQALKDRAVPTVRAASVNQVRNRACSMPVLGSVSVLDDDDFLDCFLVTGLQTLALNSGVVVVLAFNEEVVWNGAVRRPR